MNYQNLYSGSEAHKMILGCPSVCTYCVKESTHRDSRCNVFHTIAFCFPDVNSVMCFKPYQLVLLSSKHCCCWWGIFVAFEALYRGVTDVPFVRSRGWSDHPSGEYPSPLCLYCSIVGLVQSFSFFSVTFLV